MKLLKTAEKRIYKMGMKFYRCSICGQIVGIVKKADTPLICCGKPMEELIPCSTDAAYEKHVPEIRTEGYKVYVSVGSVPHPMQKEHFIEWIALETKCGNQRKMLKPETEPKACFCICPGDEVVAVYAYCNLHGLWKATLK